MIFSESSSIHVAQAFPPGGGYGSFLHGKVVDMLHFPLVKSSFPDWMPLVGGTKFEFFAPIFNIADASISIGVITLLVFQKRFMHKEETDAVANDHDADRAISTEEAKHMI
jgi:signal peptidase II